MELYLDIFISTDQASFLAIFFQLRICYFKGNRPVLPLIESDEILVQPFSSSSVNGKKMKKKFHKLLIFNRQIKKIIISHSYKTFLKEIYFANSLI